MARISAVTALRSHATFLRGVVVATYSSTACRSLAGCCVTRSLRRGALSVAISPCDATNMLPAGMASLSGTSILPTPASATVIGVAAVASVSESFVLCAISWASLRWYLIDVAFITS